MFWSPLLFYADFGRVRLLKNLGSFWMLRLALACLVSLAFGANVFFCLISFGMLGYSLACFGRSFYFSVRMVSCFRMFWHKLACFTVFGFVGDTGVLACTLRCVFEHVLECVVICFRTFWDALGCKGMLGDVWAVWVCVF